jgi:putative hemolysin
LVGIILQLLAIAVLVILNGFFSCSELAIVSLRKSRLTQLVEDGEERARIVEELQKDPHRLLAIVQIGVTLMGSFASAIGGIIAVEEIKPLLLQVPNQLIREAAEPIAVSAIVILVAYFSLIIGELVPKTIGLHYAEVVALRVARPIQVMAAISGVAVTFLTWSSRTVLGIMRIKAGPNEFITREEVQHIVAEGQESGVFTEAEHEYIKNIFDFTHTSVREVMVPRTRMLAIDLGSTQEEMLQTILEHKYSRYPVYRDQIENIVGFIHGKDFLGGVLSGSDFSVATIIRPPFFVPETKKVNELLEEMQRQRIHMAMVVDEYGGISGLVTTEDLLEELVGEIEDEHDEGEPGKIIRLDDGRLEVDALLSLSDLAAELHADFPEDAPYDTLAGLILDSLGRFPEHGEQLRWQDYLFTCVAVTNTAIQRVLIQRVTVDN